MVAINADDEVPVISDSSGWASLYRPLEPTVADPNKAPTEVAPSTPVVEEGETPSVPETPHLEPEDGAIPPGDGVVGVATRIEGKETMTQTPPLLSRLIQGYLDQTSFSSPLITERTRTAPAIRVSCPKQTLVVPRFSKEGGFLKAWWITTTSPK